MHGMAVLFKICILYNSKFILKSKFLGTNALIFVKRLLCIFLIELSVFEIISIFHGCMVVDRKICHEDH